MKAISEQLTSTSFQDVDKETLDAEFKGEAIMDTTAVDAFRSRTNGLSMAQFVGRLRNMERFHRNPNVRQYAANFIVRLPTMGYDDFTKSDYDLIDLANKLHGPRLIVDNTQITG